MFVRCQRQHDSGIGWAETAGLVSIGAGSPSSNEAGIAGFRCRRGGLSARETPNRWSPSSWIVVGEGIWRGDGQPINPVRHGLKEVLGVGMIVLWDWCTAPETGEAVNPNLCDRDGHE